MMWINRKKWEDIERLLMKKGFGKSIKIYKFEIEHPKRAGYKETILGDPKGAIRQYRKDLNGFSVHIREYRYYYEVHLDRVNPEKDPLGHLIHDAPEWGLIFAILGLMFIFSRKRKRLLFTI